MRAGGSGYLCESSAMPMVHTAAHSFIPSPKKPTGCCLLLGLSTRPSCQLQSESIDLQGAKSINPPSSSNTPLPLLPLLFLYPLSCLHCYSAVPPLPQLVREANVVHRLSPTIYSWSPTQPKDNKVVTDLILPGFRAAALRAFVSPTHRKAGNPDCVRRHGDLH